MRTMHKEKKACQRCGYVRMVTIHDRGTLISGVSTPKETWEENCKPCSNLAKADYKYQDACKSKLWT